MSSFAVPLHLGEGADAGKDTGIGEERVLGSDWAAGRATRKEAIVNVSNPASSTEMLIYKGIPDHDCS